MNKQSFLKLILEMGAVFIGISASFWVENYRIEKHKEQNLKASLEMIISDLNQDIELLEMDSINYIKTLLNMESVIYRRTENTDTLYQFFVGLQGALYVDINQIGYSLLIEGDGFEVLDRGLFRKISNFYSSTVVGYLGNTAHSDAGELSMMVNLREYMFESSVFKGFFPKKEELSKASQMLNDPVLYRRLDALYLYRWNNQSNTNDQLRESRKLREEIKSYLVEI